MKVLAFARLALPSLRPTALGALCLGAALGLSACASKPEAPILTRPSGAAAAETAARLRDVLPAELLLLGEQHDAAEHQLIEQQVVATLAAQGKLGAVALEMAAAGLSTAKLHPSSSEEQVRLALRWSDDAWPWAAYGPAIMTAVRAGVPVLGANLPRADMKSRMSDTTLDTALPGAALQAQQASIRQGHCDLLPEAQILPLTRVQIAKDISMAATLSHAALPGKVVVLLTGAGHADRMVGVPQHLAPSVRVKAVRMQAGSAEGAEPAGAFDAVWPTAPVAAKDYCAGLKQRLRPAADVPHR